MAFSVLEKINVLRLLFLPLENRETSKEMLSKKTFLKWNTIFRNVLMSAEYVVHSVIVQRQITQLKTFNVSTVF